MFLPHELLENALQLASPGYFLIQSYAPRSIHTRSPSTDHSTCTQGNVLVVKSEYMDEFSRVSLVAENDQLRSEVARIASLAGVNVEFSWSEHGVTPAVLRLRQVSEHTLTLSASFHPSYAPYFVEGNVTLTLPQEAEDLLELMLAAASTARGTVVGVIGAQGGVGATSFASILARGYAREGSTALIDLDPLSPGVDLGFHLRTSPGLRWADLVEEQGSLVPGRLRAALPRLGNLAILSADERGGVHTNAAGIGGGAFSEVGERAIAALSQVSEVSVLDLPRWALRDGEGERAWISWCDALVVLVRSDESSLHAARRVLTWAGQTLALHVVGAGVRSRGECAQMARDLEVGKVWPWRRHKGLRAELAHGLGLGERKHASFVREVMKVGSACRGEKQ